MTKLATHANPKKKKAKAAPATTTDDGLIADPKKEGIPVFLQTQNRDKVFPINDDVKAKLEAAAAAANKIRPFDQPKGMSDDEYNAMKNKARIAEEDKKAARIASLPKREKKRPEAPKGTFTLRDLARRNDIDPRVARAVARANADTLKPMWAEGHKHIFWAKDEAKVLEIVKAGAAKKPAKKAKKAAKKIVIPPPSETVWSGKAKVKRTNTAPPQPSSKKQEAAAEVAKMMKGNKKKAAAKREADIDAKARTETPNEKVRAEAVRKALRKDEASGKKAAPRVASIKK